VILTDPIVESKMDDALAQIQALPAIRGEIVRIRITIYKTSITIGIRHDGVPIRGEAGEGIFPST
jgi:hypothetical protein